MEEEEEKESIISSLFCFSDFTHAERIFFPFQKIPMMYHGLLQLQLYTNLLEKVVFLRLAGVPVDLLIGLVDQAAHVSFQGLVAFMHYEHIVQVVESTAG